MSASDLYDKDFYEWTVRNAELLRTGRAAEADLAHIAEEIEDMGKREKRELLSRLTILLLHMLKWDVQRDLRSRSWTSTIRAQRQEIADLLQEMPSLRAYLEDRVGQAYRRAVERAADESLLTPEAFPAACPWTLGQILDSGFLPE